MGDFLKDFVTSLYQYACLFVPDGLEGLRRASESEMAQKDLEKASMRCTRLKQKNVKHGLGDERIDGHMEILICVPEGITFAALHR